MIRRWIVVAVLLGILYLIFHFTLPQGKKSVKSPHDDFYVRTVRLVDPPFSSVQKGPDLKYTRMLDRIAWGTTASVNRTIECLAMEPKKPFIPEVVRRIQRDRASNPSRAKRYIDLLAELDDPATLPILIGCVSDVSGMVRMAALKGVSRFDERLATECLLEHARSPFPRTRDLCRDLLVERNDPEVLAFFKEMLQTREASALPFAMKALGAFGGPECRPLIRPFLDHADYTIRTVALQSLLRLGDDLAATKLEASLTHPGIVIRKGAVQNLYYARCLPPMKILLSLAKDPEESVRILFVSVLGALVGRFEGGGLLDLPELPGVLREHQRPEIRQKAVEGLYRSGREEVILPYLRKVEEAFGAEFDVAVSLLTTLLKSEESGPLLIERFRGDPDLTYKERVTILSGLSDLAFEEAAGLFFEVIRGEWACEIPASSAFPLDRVATFKIHNLGDDLIPLWLEVLENDSTEYMRYLFINSARNMEDARAAGKLLEIASNRAVSHDLRKEAVLTFAFLRNLSLGPLLLQYAGRETDPELSGLAQRVFWNFF